MLTVAEKASNAGKLVMQAIGNALSSVHAGEEKIVSNQAGQNRVLSLQISSGAFIDGGSIPTHCTPQGVNSSPELTWSGVPVGTRELVLIVEDPDAPFMKPFVHWILHRLPPSVHTLPAALPTTIQLSDLGGAVQGVNDAKTRGWFGPQPPRGHGVHHYHFQLFAVDTQLSLGPDATRDELSRALHGHVLASGELIGTYERTAYSD
jgi:Raf kinase inhibitor-like YbhB/YbcL family protein